MPNIYKHKSPYDAEAVERLNILNECAKILSEEADIANDRTTDTETSLMEINRRRESIEANRSTGLGIELQNPGGPGMHKQGRFRTTGRSGGGGEFQNFGDFALSIRDACRPGSGGVVDNRLIAAAAPDFSSESIGEEGGFAVPPEFRAEIWKKVAGEDSLLARTDMLKPVGNSISIPTDESPPWDKTKGPQIYWGSEGEEKKGSKIALKLKTLRLNKAFCLVPVSDELLEDATGLDTYLRRKVGDVFDFDISLKIVQGSGAGEPLGIFNSPSLLVVEAEDAQVADTIITENLLRMWSGLHPGCAKNAVWVASPSTRPQLLQLQWPNSGLGGIPAFMPNMSLAGRPFEVLLGRPIIFSEVMNPLGDKGDIVLVDFSQYMSAVKRGGLRTDVSIHLWFDYDLTAYRFVMRLAGQPWWSTKILGRDGITEYSWAVTLAERAG